MRVAGAAVSSAAGAYIDIILLCTPKNQGQNYFLNFFSARGMNAATQANNYVHGIKLSENRPNLVKSGSLVCNAPFKAKIQQNFVR
jgi:hypothetical protein